MKIKETQHYQRIFLYELLITYTIIVLRKLRELVNMDNSTMSEKQSETKNENSNRDIEIIKIKKNQKEIMELKKYNKCKEKFNRDCQNQS